MQISKRMRWATLTEQLRVRDACQTVGGLVVAFVLLVFLLPLIADVAMVVKVTLGSPVIFRQERPGRYGVPFVMLKFRTMTEARNGSGRLLPDAERLTRVGRFLRRSSMDELPQLWNVLRGSMSLIGSRPLLTRYLEYYTGEQASRHEVRPGITGWAQVQGRQELPFSRRLKLDVSYVSNLTFLLDLKIAALTIVRTLRGSGVHSGQDVRDVDDLGFHSGTRTDREAQ